MKTTRIFAATALAMLCFSSRASADLIFEKQVDPNLYGFTAQLKAQQTLDSFTLTDSATITSIHWVGQFGQGLYGTGTDAGNFNLYIFNDNPNWALSPSANSDHLNPSGLPAGAPLLNVHAGASGVGLGVADPLLGGELRDWSATIPEITLEAGTYWFSVAADPAKDPENFFIWNRAIQESAITVFGTLVDPQTLGLHITAEFGAMAFSLQGISLDQIPVLENSAQIPDRPYTFSLLTIGLCAVATRRRLLDLDAARKRNLA